MNNLAPEALDYRAGCAYRSGQFGKARGVLAQAQMLHPDQSQLWADRLAQVEAKDPAVKDHAPAKCCEAWSEVIADGNECPSCAAAKVCASKQGKPPGNIPYLPETMSDGRPFTPTISIDPERETLPRPAAQAYPTVRGERSPEPPPGHYCPDCTTTYERDGKTITHGPQVPADRNECHGCGIIASKDLSVVPLRDEKPPPFVSGKSCARCGDAAPGPGGIICPPCREDIEHPQRVPVREPEPGQ